MNVLFLLLFVAFTTCEDIEYQKQTSPLLDQKFEFNDFKNFNWTEFNTLEEIYSWLDFLSRKYPENVQVIVAGETYEGREIRGVKLSFKEGNPGIFLEGGIHAREWLAPATVTFLIHQLLTNEDPEVRELAESNDWYIVPVANPDGYVFTHTVNRKWRKNRSRNNGECIGVDLNRNWGFQWMNLMTANSSNDSCSDRFGGAEAFSEIETKSLSEFILTLSGKLYAYIAFHSFGQCIMFPYSHTHERVKNYNELLEIGTEAAKALSQRYGTDYRVGSIADTYYTASGASADWVYETLNVPLTFGYELRDKGKYGNYIPPISIIPTGEETLDSLIGLFKAAKRFGYPKNY